MGGTDEGREAVAAEDHVQAVQKELETAKKVAVGAEVRAELAGKDQRAIEQVQAVAEAKADEAETKKSNLYVSTQQLCDRAASTNDAEDKAACEKAKMEYENAQSRAQTAIRESEALSEQAIMKADQATKLKVSAALAAEKAGKLPVPAERQPSKTLTEAKAKDVLESDKPTAVDSGNSSNVSTADLQEQVRQSRVEAELADANARKVALEAKVATGKPSNKTIAALAVENGKIKVAEAKAKLEKLKVSNASTTERTKAAMDLTVARGEEDFAVSEQKVADAPPDQRAAYEKAAAIDAVATTMEKVGSENGDEKLMEEAKKEA